MVDFFMIHVAKYTNRPMDPLLTYDIVGFWEGSSVPMKFLEPLPDGPCQVRKKNSQGFNFPRVLQNLPLATFGDGYSYNGK